MRKLYTMFLVLFLFFGCAHYTVHPGAVNSFDSQTYDALIGAKTVIDTGRDQLASGALPQSVKPALNTLIKAYDTAYPVYKTYHDAASSGKPADQYLADLNRDMTELTKALTAFKGGK